MSRLSIIYKLIPVCIKICELKFMPNSPVYSYGNWRYPQYLNRYLVTYSCSYWWRFSYKNTPKKQYYFNPHYRRLPGFKACDYGPSIVWQRKCHEEASSVRKTAHCALKVVADGLLDGLRTSFGSVLTMGHSKCQQTYPNTHAQFDESSLCKHVSQSSTSLIITRDPEYS